ncbi:MAG: glycosyltransferase family 2 protein [Halanaerobiaceae bacterium]
MIDMVSVVIPVYNEGDIIGKTLDSLDFEWLSEIIVVDDGSRDNTRDILCDYPVEVILFSENRGKGEAVRAGCKRARGEVIALVDADTGSSVVEVEKLVLPVISGEVEVTVAVLPIRGGGLGLVRGLADRGLRFLTGRKMKAPLSGQRAFRSELLENFLPFARGFGLELGMDLDILKQGIEFREVKCNFIHRVTGQSYTGYLHRARQFRDILWTLLGELL